MEQQGAHPPKYRYTVSLPLYIQSREADGTDVVVSERGTHAAQQALGYQADSITCDGPLSSLLAAAVPRQRRPAALGSCWAAARLCWACTQAPALLRAASLQPVQEPV